MKLTASINDVFYEDNYDNMTDMERTEYEYHGWISDESVVDIYDRALIGGEVIA